MVHIALPKDEVSRKAMQFMSNKNYTMVSQTETSVSFEDGKDINTAILILGILFLLIGAIIYYLLAKKHSVLVTFNDVSGGVNVECSTNTPRSLKDSQEFLMTLPKAS